MSNRESSPLYAGVELGGTKCVCLLGTGPGDIREQVAIPTGSNPDITLTNMETILRDWHVKHGPVTALGIASFGPVDLDVRSDTYGFITSTTKPGWRSTDIAQRLSRLYAVLNGISMPTGFDTDVNGAALAEGRWGAARDLNDYAYVTVGTGVGVGLVVGGHTVRGFSHPELGHIRIARMAGDRWPGACSFHGDCVEGLASGTAIAMRTGLTGSSIAADHPVWETVAHALAQLLHTLVMATAPRRIMIGGGVVEARPALLSGIRQHLFTSVNGYLDVDELKGGIDRYVVAPGLGALAGPLGALAIAADAHKNNQHLQRS